MCLGNSCYFAPFFRSSWIFVESLQRALFIGGIKSEVEDHRGSSRVLQIPHFVTHLFHFKLINTVYR